MIPAKVWISYYGAPVTRTSSILLSSRCLPLQHTQGKIRPPTLFLTDDRTLSISYKVPYSCSNSHWISDDDRVVLTHGGRNNWLNMPSRTMRVCIRKQAGALQERSPVYRYPSPTPARTVVAFFPSAAPFPLLSLDRASLHRHPSRTPKRLRVFRPAGSRT